MGSFVLQFLGAIPEASIMYGASPGFSPVSAEWAPGILAVHSNQRHSFEERAQRPLQVLPKYPYLKYIIPVHFDTLCCPLIKGTCHCPQVRREGCHTVADTLPPHVSVFRVTTYARVSDGNTKALLDKACPVCRQSQ